VKFPEPNIQKPFKSIIVCEVVKKFYPLDWLSYFVLLKGEACGQASKKPLKFQP
jgi:hypothetical protein